MIGTKNTALGSSILHPERGILFDLTEEGIPTLPALKPLDADPAQ